MTQKEDLVSLKEEFRKTAGYNFIKKINHFYLTTYIFHENFVELNEHLKIQVEPYNAFRLAQKENRKEQQSLQFKTVRLLHNFVASAISLIDHTRVFIKENYIETDPFFDEYQKEIEKNFSKNPLAVFVKSLRQFVQHYQSPLIATISTLSNDKSRTDAKIMITKEILLKFSGWKSSAKIYIEQFEGDINIQTVVKEYYQLVSQFYTWFHDRQTQIHEKDLQEVERLKREIRLAKLFALVTDFASSDVQDNELFKTEVRNLMGTIEKKYFDNINPRQQMAFLIATLKVNNREIPKNMMLLLNKYSI